MIVSVLLRSLLVVAPALPQPGAAPDVFVVDGKGGPGVDFVDLQNAIDTVPPDSVLLIRKVNASFFPPDYGAVVIDRPLVLHAGPDVWISSVTAQQLPAASTLFFSGFRAVFDLDSCQGTVLGSDLTGVLRVDDCADVVVAGAFFSSGVEVRDSRVELSDGYAYGTTDFDGIGCPGVEVESGQATFALMDLRGGMGDTGGIPCGGFGAGGDGLYVQGGVVDVRGRRTDVVEAGGTNDDPSCGGSPGFAVLASSASEVRLYGVGTQGSVSHWADHSRATAASLASTRRSDGSVLFELWAHPGAMAVIALAAAPRPFAAGTPVAGSAVAVLTLDPRGYGAAILDPSEVSGAEVFAVAQAWTPFPPSGYPHLSNRVPVLVGR